MSKKINISIPNKVKPNLISLFHEYLVRKAKEPKRRCNGERYIWDDEDYEDVAAYWDRVFPGWDDDIDDDDVDIVYPLGGAVLNSKKHKGKKDVYSTYWTQEDREDKWSKKVKHKHKKGKKSRIIDITQPYSGDEDDFDFNGIDIDFTTDDYDDEQKEIWFYPDYHDKDDRLEFNTLKEFSDYCESMGYWVSKEVANEISWRYETHCCLDPDSEKQGLLEIITEHSYGELFYEVCKEEELSCQ